MIHTPIDKLQDAFIGMLAGAQGLVETNKRVRPDRVLQAAFDRQGCAEQSTISETLNACTEENVTQLKEALQVIYRQHSAGYRHNYQERFQLLDADTSGMPAGKKAELSTKGYFPRQRNRRGRQLARVVASWYDEIVVDQFYAGKVQLTQALQPLILAAEEVLELDEARRRRTVLRIDAGGESEDDVNWVLERDYHLLVKDYSTKRTTRLAKSVQTWYPDKDPWARSGPGHPAPPLCSSYGADSCPLPQEEWAVVLCRADLYPLSAGDSGSDGPTGGARRGQREGVVSLRALLR